MAYSRLSRSRLEYYPKGETRHQRKTRRDGPTYYLWYFYGCYCRYFHQVSIMRCHSCGSADLQNRRSLRSGL